MRGVLMTSTYAVSCHPKSEDHAQVPCEERMTADFSPIGLRVLREVAQSGSFSAAARSLGYTQSAVSRQVAGLEAVAGRRLFERSRSGVALPPAGARLLPRAARILDELDRAQREAAGEPVPSGPVRIGAFASA